MSRILIADDEAYIRDLLVKYIRDGESAEEVEAAGDGREALEKARAFRPDIVAVSYTHLDEYQKTGLRLKTGISG